MALFCFFEYETSSSQPGSHFQSIWYIAILCLLHPRRVHSCETEMPCPSFHYILTTQTIENSKTGKSQSPKQLQRSLFEFENLRSNLKVSSKVTRYIEVTRNPTACATYNSSTVSKFGVVSPIAHTRNIAQIWSPTCLELTSMSEEHR